MAQTNVECDTHESCGGPGLGPVLGLAEVAQLCPEVVQGDRVGLLPSTPAAGLELQ